MALATDLILFLCLCVVFIISAITQAKNIKLSTKLEEMITLNEQLAKDNQDLVKMIKACEQYSLELYNWINSKYYPSAKPTKTTMN